MARIVPHRPASGAQSRSADPRPRPSAAGACCWRANRALRRRLQTLAGEFAKKSRSFDPALVPKVGATLVRQWRGHAHTVLVRDDGFEYERKHYHSLTVIAERITRAHWSGPRFFGLTKRTAASVSAEAGE